MKIIILDDDGSTLYEQDDPGYIHLPTIYDDKFAVSSCDEDDCPDPRCVERRAEAEQFLEQWSQSGQDLAFYYHLPRLPSEEALEVRFPSPCGLLFFVLVLRGGGIRGHC